MKRFNTRLPGSIQKCRLDEFLLIWLPQVLGEPISKTKIRKLVLAGAVYVNRHRNKNPTTPLYSGAIVEVYYDEDVMKEGQPARAEETRMDTSRILFEDEWLIVVDKPNGLPTQPTVDPFRANLFDMMKQFLSQRDHVEKPYVGLHHRLDKDTSGIVMFTKKEEANKGISDLFLQQKIKKTYQCVVWRMPQSPVYQAGDEFQIENFLGKINEKNQNSKFGSVKSGGDYALTQFKVIEDFRDAYWLEASPQTGRTHQIRVHCSEIGLPIFGDVIYFPAKMFSIIVAPRLLLHAYQLRFQHPITQKQIEIECPLPSEFVSLLGTLIKS